MCASFLQIMKLYDFVRQNLVPTMIDGFFTVKCLYDLHWEDFIIKLCTLKLLPRTAYRSRIFLTHFVEFYNRANLSYQPVSCYGNTRVLCSKDVDYGKKIFLLK